jgi:hypothetical protein
MFYYSRDRKGEHAELFADMQAQGYVRFRINGQIVEAADLKPLVKNEKHDIDVVVDRLKVKPDMQQRLAESFEAALRLFARPGGSMTKFDCTSCQDALADCLDAERQPTGDLAAHLAECTACAAAYPGPLGWKCVRADVAAVTLCAALHGMLLTWHAAPLLH